MFFKIIAHDLPDPRTLSEEEVLLALHKLGRAIRSPDFRSAFPASADAEEVLRAIARRHQNLSEHEERFLVRVAKGRAVSKSGAQAMDILQKSYMRFIMRVAKSFRDSSIPYADILQEGCVGLAIAVDTSDWDFINFDKKNPKAKPSPFHNHAFFKIKRSITSAFPALAGINVPEATYWKMLSVTKSDNVLKRAALSRYGRKLSLTEADVREYQQQFKPFTEMYSLDNEAYSLQTTLGGMENFTSDTALIKIDIAKALVKSGLNEQRRDIIDLRLGLRDGAVYTQQEVADRLHISKMRVCQEEERAMGAIYNSRALRGLVKAYIKP